MPRGRVASTPEIGTGAQVKVQVYIRGISPLMMHGFTTDDKTSIWTGVKQDKPKGAPYKDECRLRIYRIDGATRAGANGVRVGIPLLNITRCLVLAGQDVKIEGATKFSTEQRTRLFELVQILRNDGTEFTDDQTQGFPFELDEEPDWDPEEAWEVDVRPTRANNTPGAPAVMAVRPKFRQWGLWVTLLVEKAYVKKVNELFRRAGRGQGLCSFRPGKGRGNFGMFTVKHWEVADVKV